MRELARSHRSREDCITACRLSLSFRCFSTDRIERWRSCPRLCQPLPSSWIIEKKEA